MKSLFIFIILIFSSSVFAIGGIVFPKAPTRQTFTVPGTTSAKLFSLNTTYGATTGATYTNNGQTFTVLATISGGSYLLASYTGASTSSGTLTKATGAGDASIIFTSVNDVARYTKPSGVLYFKLRMVGSGGDGGAGSTSNAGSGGAAGGYCESIISDSTNWYYIVPTLSGYDSIFTNGVRYIYAGGGEGGFTGSASGGVRGGVGGVCTGADLNIQGGDGGSCLGVVAGAQFMSGNGGSSFFGGGGYAGGTSVGNGAGGRAYGAGGGGGASTGGTGGPGKLGLIIIDEFYQ